MGLKGAVSSTLATWTKQGIAEFSGATSLNSAGESKKIIERKEPSGLMKDKRLRICTQIPQDGDIRTNQ